MTSASGHRMLQADIVGGVSRHALVGAMQHSTEVGTAFVFQGKHHTQTRRIHCTATPKMSGINCS